VIYYGQRPFIDAMAWLVLAVFFSGQLAQLVRAHGSHP
jgi:hypothetical protein